MNWAIAGSLALGFFVGYVSMMFIIRAVNTDSKAKNLAAFLGVILTGTAAQFLTSRMGADPTNFSQYAVGLAIGLVVYIILYALSHDRPPTTQVPGGTGPGGRSFPLGGGGGRSFPLWSGKR